MTPFNTLLLAAVCALASRAEAISAPVGLSPASSYEQWLQWQKDQAGAGAGARADEGLTNGQTTTLDKNFDCASGGDASCALVTNVPAGQLPAKLESGETISFYVDAQGVKHKELCPPAGVAGPCQPLTPEKEKQIIGEITQRQKARLDAVRKQEAARIAAAEGGEAAGGVSAVAKGPKKGAVTQPVDLFAAAHGGGMGSAMNGTSDVDPGNGNNPAGAGGGGPTLAPQPQPSDSVVSANGKVEKLGDIGARVAGSVAGVWATMLKSGNVATYSQAGLPGSAVTAAKDSEVPALYQPGSCEGTYASLCDANKARKINTILNSGLKEFTSDGKAVGAADPAHLGGDTKSFGSKK